ncbi:MAG: hypothetical protein AAGD14_13515 [Planctomycetota bacterium]
MRVLACILLLALPSAAQEWRWTRAERGEQLAKSELRGAFEILMPDDGTLLLPGANNQRVSPRTAYRALLNARDSFDRAQPPAAGEPSGVPVLLRVDPDVPWQHVQIVLQIVGEAQCPNVWFVVSPDGKQTRYLSARLPVGEKPGASYVRYELALDQRISGSRAWAGGGSVDQIRTVYFRHGRESKGEALQARAEVESFVRKVRERSPDIRFRGALVPAATVPFRLVVDGLQAFDRRVFPVVLFRRTLNRRSGQPTLPFPVDQGPMPRDLGWIGENVAVVRSDQEKPWGDGKWIDEDVRMPLVSTATPESRNFGPSRFAVNLNRHGELRVAGKQRSLRNFRSWLADRGGSKPRMLLRVDARAPWAHVVSLLQVAEDAGWKQVEFGVRKTADEADSALAARRFQATHKRDLRRNAPEAEGYLPILLRPTAGDATPVDRVRLEAARLAPAGWGPPGAREKIVHPTYVNMRYRDRATVMFSVLRTRLGGDAKNPSFLRTLMSVGSRRFDLGITEKVPAGYAIATLCQLQTLGFRQFSFFPERYAFDGENFTRLHQRYPAQNRVLEAR